MKRFMKFLLGFCVTLILFLLPFYYGGYFEGDIDDNLMLCIVAAVCMSFSMGIVGMGLEF